MTNCSLIIFLLSLPFSSPSILGFRSWFKWVKNWIPSFVFELECLTERFRFQCNTYRKFEEDPKRTYQETDFRLSLFPSLNEKSMWKRRKRRKMKRKKKGNEERGKKMMRALLCFNLLAQDNWTSNDTRSMMGRGRKLEKITMILFFLFFSYSILRSFDDTEKKSTSLPFPL